MSSDDPKKLVGVRQECGICGTHTLEPTCGNCGSYRLVPVETAERQRSPGGTADPAVHEPFGTEPPARWAMDGLLRSPKITA